MAITRWNFKLPNFGAGKVLGYINAAGDVEAITISGSPTGPAGGDLAGTYPNPTVVSTSLAAPLPLAQGGTASSTAATARAALGAAASGANNDITSLLALTDLIIANKIDTSTRTLKNSGGFNAVDWQNLILKNTAGTTMMDFSAGNSSIKDLLGAPSIYPDSRGLYDSTGTESIDWELRRARNSSAVIVIDWQNERLQDTSGNKSVAWQERVLYKIGGTTQALNWQSLNLAGSWTLNSYDIPVKLNYGPFNVTFGSVAVGDFVDVTIAAGGVALGECFAIGPPAAQDTGLDVEVLVKTVNNITFRAHNVSTLPITQGLLVYNAIIIR